VEGHGDKNKFRTTLVTISVGEKKANRESSEHAEKWKALYDQN
jgi:hypothetical protein